MATKILTDATFADEIKNATKMIAEDGVENIVISSIFAPLNNSMEKETEAIIKEVYPEANITLSSEIGSIGLLERENSAVLNGALQKLAPTVINSVKQLLVELNIKSRIYLTQNDGTLISTKYAEQYPVFTIASGPTNSIRGAAFSLV